MRLFLFNPEICFDFEQIVTRAKVSPNAARSEIRLLADVRLIKPRTFIKEEKKKVGNKSEKVKKRVKGWVLNESFPYLIPLQSFLINMSPLQDQTIVRKFNRTGKIKLLITSGVFIQEKDSRVDILVVGDGLSKGMVESTVKDLEAELGKELTYSLFETRDFNYRLGMYDKLVRDILDYPHKKLVNRLAL